MKLIFTDLTYQKTSGGQNLIYEIVKTAYNKRQIPSVLIGDLNSFVIKRLNEDHVPFEFINQSQANQNELQFSDADVLINFHNHDEFWRLSGFRGKCVIWGILAPQVTNWNRFGIEKKLTGKKLIADHFTKGLIKRLKKKDSLISMDGATADAINKFVGRNCDWPIIPIPIDVNDARTPRKSKKDKKPPLVLSYVGRSDDIWKIKPLKKIVKDLSHLADKNFKINIYTDCAHPYITELNEIPTSNISMEFFHGLYGPALRSHLNSHSDLHFSMGTAALEGGLAGVPTILVDPCDHDMPEEYRYRWLYETERHSLGRFIDPGDADFSGIEMRKVVASCLDEDERVRLAELNQAYVLQNHSTTVVVEKLLAHPTKATMQDIVRFTPATWAIRPYIGAILKK